MQEQMTKMHEEMIKIQQTQDPQERQRLMEDHWTSMQDTMTTMRETWGGMMGCCGKGGEMRENHKKNGTMMGMGGPVMIWENTRSSRPSS